MNKYQVVYTSTIKEGKEVVHYFITYTEEQYFRHYYLDFENDGLFINLEEMLSEFNNCVKFPIWRDDEYHIENNVLFETDKLEEILKINKEDYPELFI